MVLGDKKITEVNIGEGFIKKIYHGSEMVYERHPGNLVAYQDKMASPAYIIRIYVGQNKLDLSKLKPITKYKFVCYDKTGKIIKCYLGNNSSTSYFFQQVSGLEAEFTTPEVMPNYNDMAAYLYAPNNVTITEEDMKKIDIAIYEI